MSGEFLENLIKTIVFLLPVLALVWNASKMNSRIEELEKDAKEKNEKFCKDLSVLEAKIEQERIATDSSISSVLATFQNFILNQNKLSDYEAITLSTTNLQVDYDGFITIAMYASSAVYINDVQVASIRDVSGTPNTTTIPVNKGDNIRITGTFRFGNARWYKNRYYEN